MTPAKCPACQGPHSALDGDCPRRLEVKEMATIKYEQRLASLAGAGSTENPPPAGR